MWQAGDKDIRSNNEVTARLYNETHEWIQIDDGVGTVGITDFAQAQLGDVVFMELPSPGAAVSAGEAFGVIESVKAASDLYSPVDGEVVEVNSELQDKPELVNQDPFGAGWLIRVRLAGEPGRLLDEAAYRAQTEGSS